MTDNTQIEDQKEKVSFKNKFATWYKTNEQSIKVTAEATALCVIVTAGTVGAIIAGSHYINTKVQYDSVKDFILNTGLEDDYRKYVIDKINTELKDVKTF